jgi:hypothetical protein
VLKKYLETANTWRQQILGDSKYLETANTWRQEILGDSIYLETANTWRQQILGDSKYLETANTWRQQILHHYILLQMIIFRKCILNFISYADKVFSYQVMS